MSSVWCWIPTSGNTPRFVSCVILALCIRTGTQSASITIVNRNDVKEHFQRDSFGARPNRPPIKIKGAKVRAGIHSPNNWGFVNKFKHRERNQKIQRNQKKKTFGAQEKTPFDSSRFALVAQGKLLVFLVTIEFTSRPCGTSAEFVVPRRRLTSSRPSTSSGLAQHRLLVFSCRR